MADYTKVYRSIWRDRDFLALPSSAQRTYTMLMSQPNINSAGVLTLAVARWASYAPDTTVESVRADLAVLEAARYIIIDTDTDELMVRTLIKADELYKQRNGPRSIEIAMSEVLSDRLADAIVTEAARVEVTLEPRVKQAGPSPTPTVEPLSHPHPVPVPQPLSTDKPPAPKPPGRFEEFYGPYPRKEGKGAAQAAYVKALKHATHEEIMVGLERMLPWLRQKQTEGFCVQPARWLNEQRWLDEPGGTNRRATTHAATRASALERLDERLRAVTADEPPRLAIHQGGIA